MLQNIGDKLKGQGEGGSRAHRWFWYLILGALALVFAAWGPYAVVDLSFGQNDAAATVNGEDIPAAEINDLWQRQLPELSAAHGGELTEEQRAMYQRQLINVSVRETVTTQHASELGVAISDAQVARAFRQEEAFQIDGQFSVLEAQARLANAGISERTYLDDLRKRLQSNRLLSVIGATDFLTQAEAKRILALLDEEREVRFVLLDPEDHAGKAPVEPAAVEAWYQSHLDDFAVPESVRLVYAELSLADVAGRVTVTEEQLRARYEQDKAQYVQPEMRNARHILLSVADESEDAAKAEAARKLYEQIRGGGDFAALAREHSEDSASAADGGSLDWATRETYVPAFGDKLFSMREGEVSEPVKTEFGYHIIKLEGIRPEVSRPFEAVRDELTVAVRNEAAITLFNDQQDRLQEQLEAGSANFDAVVQEFGMRRGEVAKFERGGGGLPLGSDANLNRLVFSEESISQRRVGGPVQLSDDRVTIFRVEDHKPATTRPLEEVRDEIIATLIRERGAEAALKAAQAAVDDLAAGKRFEQVAAALKARPEPARFVGRQTPDMPVEVRDALFAAKRPTPESPVRQALRMEDGTVALFESTATRTGAQLDVPQLVELRSQRELERYTRRDIEAYVGTLVDEAKVRVNPQAFAQQ